MKQMFTVPTLATTIALALTLSCTAGAFAQDTDRLAAANARCEAARQKMLQPIRARKIAQCKQRADRPTAGCETFYSTYGNNSNNANGAVVRGRFYNLPACVAARRLGLASGNDQNF